MSDFLGAMARSSEDRVAQALLHESRAALERRARSAPPAPPLRLSPAGFDVIAELKLKSPAAGVLKGPAHDWRSRVAAYARAGAAAVSVLTEPSRFDGALEHLREAAALLAPLGVPAMRKDFLVDPYQVLEARAAGAGGVLVILRMLPRERIVELLQAAADHGLFVLLEAFDARDLELARELLGGARDSGARDSGVRDSGERDSGARDSGERDSGERDSGARGGGARHSGARGGGARGGGARGGGVLVGINCRDLATLEVVPARFEELAPWLPEGVVAVAESGVAAAADARRMRQLGYRAALVGTALMTRDDPGVLLAEMFAAARTVRS
jgi:indole-3-glycerol phosphate synthase